MLGKNVKGLKYFAGIHHTFHFICKTTCQINIIIRTGLETAPQARFRWVRPIFVRNVSVLRKRGHRGKPREEKISYAYTESHVFKEEVSSRAACVECGILGYL